MTPVSNPIKDHATTTAGMGPNLVRYLRQTEGAIIDCKRRLRDRARRGEPLEPVLAQLSKFKREAADLRRAIPVSVSQPQ